MSSKGSDMNFHAMNFMMQNMGNMMMNTMMKNMMSSSMNMKALTQKQQHGPHPSHVVLSETGRVTAGVLYNSQSSFPSTVSSNLVLGSSEHTFLQPTPSSLFRSNTAANFSEQPQQFLPAVSEVVTTKRDTPTNNAVTSCSVTSTVRNVSRDPPFHGQELTVDVTKETRGQVNQEYQESFFPSSLLSSFSNVSDSTPAGNSSPANPQFVSKIIAMMTKGSLPGKEHLSCSQNCLPLGLHPLAQSLILSERAPLTTTADTMTMDAKQNKNSTTPTDDQHLLEHALQGILSNYGKPLSLASTSLDLNTSDSRIKDTETKGNTKFMGRDSQDDHQSQSLVKQQQEEPEGKHEEKPVEQKVKRSQRTWSCQKVYDGMSFISGQSQVEGTPETRQQETTSSRDPQQIHGVSCNEFNSMRGDCNERKGHHEYHDESERKQKENRIQEESWSQLEKWVKALPPDHSNSLVLLLLRLLETFFLYPRHDQENDDDGHDQRMHLRGEQERRNKPEETILSHKSESCMRIREDRQSFELNESHSKAILYGSLTMECSPAILEYSQPSSLSL
jgi:hypothetical protein